MDFLLNSPLILPCPLAISYYERSIIFLIVYGPSFGLINFEGFSNTALQIGLVFNNTLTYNFGDKTKYMVTSREQTAGL